MGRNSRSPRKENNRSRQGSPPRSPSYLSDIQAREEEIRSLREQLSQFRERFSALQLDNEFIKTQFQAMQQDNQALRIQMAELLAINKSLSQQMEQERIESKAQNARQEELLAQLVQQGDSSKPQPEIVAMEVALTDSSPSSDFPTLPNLNFPKTHNKSLIEHMQINAKRALQSRDPRLNKKPRQFSSGEELPTTPETSLPVAPQEPKIPPIVLRQPEKWVEVTQKFKNKNLHFKDAKPSRLGIQIYPKSSDDHRGITQTLRDEGLQYHTYFLEEEKHLNIIIRGVDMHVDLKDVKLALVEQGFEPLEIYRLKIGPDNRLTPLIKILVPKASKDEVFNNLTHLLYFPVTVELQRSNKPKGAVNQCHNCQQFGHSAQCCKAKPKCHKCAGDHYFRDCLKSKDTPAMCINCGGDHPANHSRCPKNPLNRPPAKKVTSTTTEKHPSSTQDTQPPQPTKPQAPKPQAPKKAPLAQSAPQFNQQLISMLTLTPEEMEIRFQALDRLVKSHHHLNSMFKQGS